jgi:uncharacterized membrane-anchored protein YhcB (DUF1043 family)
VDNKPAIIPIICIVLFVGLVAGAYFIGRGSGPATELADINRKIDSINASITSQQREIENQIDGVTKLFESVTRNKTSCN